MTNTLAKLPRVGHVTHHATERALERMNIEDAAELIEMVEKAKDPVILPDSSGEYFYHFVSECLRYVFIVSHNQELVTVSYTIANANHYETYVSESEEDAIPRKILVHDDVIAALGGLTGERKPFIVEELSKVVVEKALNRLSEESNYESCTLKHVFNGVDITFALAKLGKYGIPAVVSVKGTSKTVGNASKPRKAYALLRGNEVISVHGSEDKAKIALAENYLRQRMALYRIESTLYFE